MSRIRIFFCKNMRTHVNTHTGTVRTTRSGQYLLQYLHWMNRCSEHSFPVSYSSHFPLAVSSSFSISLSHTHTHCRCSLYISQMKTSQIYSHTPGFQLQMQLRQRNGVCVCEFLKMSSQLPAGKNLYLREVSFVRGEKLDLFFFFS